MSGKSSFDDYEFFFEQNVHFGSRTIMIGTPYSYSDEDHNVNFHVASNVIKGLHLLCLNSNEPITIKLNTFGGCWNSSLAIYDAIREARLQCRVIIKGMGAVMSAGPFILQAATPGYREVYPNTSLMLHDGGNGFEGNARDFEKWADWSAFQRNQSYKMLSDAAGEKTDFWRKKLVNDYIFTAEKALELNLVDTIINLD